MVGVERLRDVDLVEEVLQQGLHRLFLAGCAVDLAAFQLRGDQLVVQPADHVVDPFRSERVFGVDEHRTTAQPTLFGRELDVDTHLVCHL